ncbi:MAG: hypothetical protein ABEN55_14065 [Bradymonadaceae bacterium]
MAIESARQSAALRREDEALTIRVEGGDFRSALWGSVEDTVHMYLVLSLVLGVLGLDIRRLDLVVSHPVGVRLQPFAKLGVQLLELVDDRPDVHHLGVQGGAASRCPREPRRLSATTTPGTALHRGRRTEVAGG